MDTRIPVEIDEVEQKVLQYLRKNRAHRLRIVDLVSDLATDRYSPVELKIAALNLVSQGQAEMSPSWELVYRGQKKREEVASAIG